MQPLLSAYYQQKVNEVLSYISTHLADDLNVKQLSEKFGISFFHFHRIMKAYLNETLGSYINRVRLETAVKLIRYTEEPLSDIAQKIGYNNCSAFSKAFSKEFGLSPQEYKVNSDIVLNTHVDYRINDSGKLISDIKPKFITVPSKKVIYTKVIDKYGGVKFTKAWGHILSYAYQNKLIGWKPDIFTVYYDEPSEVGIDNCKAELCIATNKAIESGGIIETKTIEGGRYATYRYKGPYERLWEIYETIFNLWLRNPEVRLRDFPIISKYLNCSLSGKSNNLLTEIYIPIE